MLSPPRLFLHACWIISLQPKWNVYVVVDFLSQVIFIFLLFQLHLHTLPYPKTKEKQKLPEMKN